MCGVIEYIRRDRCALVQHPNQYELVYQVCLRREEWISMMHLFSFADYPASPPPPLYHQGFSLFNHIFTCICLFRTLMHVNMHARFITVAMCMMYTTLSFLHLLSYSPWLLGVFALRTYAPAPHRHWPRAASRSSSRCCLDGTDVYRPWYAWVERIHIIIHLIVIVIFTRRSCIHACF